MSATDTAMLFGMFIFFILIGAATPFLNDEFGRSDTEYLFSFSGSDNILLDTLTIFGSIATMFFWSFGGVPIIIDAILLLPLRIFFWIILVKWIRGVGS